MAGFDRIVEGDDDDVAPAVGVAAERVVVGGQDDPFVCEIVRALEGMLNGLVDGVDVASLSVVENASSSSLTPAA